jgi:hypothetical protein
MTRPLLLSLLVSACADAPPDASAPPDALPTAEAPPPGLHLAVTPLIINEQATWLIAGATPGARVGVALGMGGAGSSCPPALGGTCIDIAGPLFVIGSAVADPNGEAQISLTVPPQAGNYQGLYFKAAERTSAGWRVSERVRATPRYSTTRMIAQTLGASVPAQQDTWDLDAYGYEAVSVGATSLAVENQDGTTVPGLTWTDLGGGAIETDLASGALDFRETNPVTLNARWTVEINTIPVPITESWTYGAVPDRTALMWTGSQLFLKTRTAVAPRDGNSTYFGFSNYFFTGAELAPGTWALTNGNSAPSLNALNLLYFSRGDHYVTSFNEAYFNTFATGPAGPGHSGSLTATGTTGFAGRVYWMNAVDRDNDGDVDGMDLAAVDLDAL